VKKDKVKDSLLPFFGGVFDYFVDLFIAEKRGSPRSSNSRALKRVVSQDLFNYSPPQFILRHETFHGYLSKAIQLAYRFLILSRYFLAFFVVKNKGRDGGWHNL